MPSSPCCWSGWRRVTNRVTRGSFGRHGTRFGGPDVPIVAARVGAGGLAFDLRRHGYAHLTDQALNPFGQLHLEYLQTETRIHTYFDFQAQTGSYLWICSSHNVNWLQGVVGNGGGYSS